MLYTCSLRGEMRGFSILHCHMERGGKTRIFKETATTLVVGNRVAVCNFNAMVPIDYDHTDAQIVCVERFQFALSMDIDYMYSYTVFLGGESGA